MGELNKEQFELLDLLVRKEIECVNDNFDQSNCDQLMDLVVLRQKLLYLEPYKDMLERLMVEAINNGYLVFGTDMYESISEVAEKLDWKISPSRSEGLYYMYRDPGHLPKEAYAELYGNWATIIGALNRDEVIHDMTECLRECFYESSGEAKYESYMYGSPDYERMTNEELVEEYKDMFESEEVEEDE